MNKDPLVLFYLIDGARPDVMKRLMDEEQLPNIRREVVEQGVFRTASSCFTSTTGPAYLPFLLGCFPGTIDIPGIRWLDKKEFAAKRIGKYRLRSYNGIEGPWFNSDLPTDRKTLHELFDNSRNIYSMITRSLGADRDLTRNTKLIRYLTAHLNDKWHRVDADGQKKLMKSLDDRPDFIFAVFPAVDSFSHIHDPFDDDTTQAYINVDGFIGEAVDKLKKQGRWGNTLLIISSDHGLTSTHTHLDLADFFIDRGRDTLRYPLIFKSKPDVSVMISGNAMGHVYLHDTIQDRPLYGSEVHDSMGSLLPELIEREEIDFLCWRESNETFSVESSRGKALIVKTTDGFKYLPDTGDPLGLGEMSRPLSQMESLEVTMNSEYPDALVQIAQIFSSSRTGDVLVTSKNGYDLRDSWEWPEHHGTHGSLCREHMIVPMIMNRNDWMKREARTADFFPSILKWAGLEVPENIDGVSLV
ncbi:MAG: alkaline phosphatase family protein [Candidatus Aegiribacteria sp.]|nr:alkaline phosphatase family protein [Candidatus Aegiribacteria sp.]